MKSEKYPYYKAKNRAGDLLKSSQNHFTGTKNPYPNVANEFKSRDTVRGLASIFTLDIDEDDEI